MKAEEGIEFGYSNEAGSQIRMIRGERAVEDASAFTQSVSESGEPVSIEHQRIQIPNEKDTRRQTTAVEELYTVKRGGEKTGEIAILLKTEFMDGRKALSLDKNAARELSADQKKEIETRKDRIIKSTAPLYLIGGVYQINLVVFKHQGDSALASLVCIHDGQMSYHDMPAKIDGGFSVWRVDDDGEFDPEYYLILAAFESAEGIELVTEWWGTEGVSTGFLKQIGNGFKMVKRGYLYTFNGIRW